MLAGLKAAIGGVLDGLATPGRKGLDEELSVGRPQVISPEEVNREYRAKHHDWMLSREETKHIFRNFPAESIKELGITEDGLRKLALFAKMQADCTFRNHGSMMGESLDTIVERFATNQLKNFIEVKQREASKNS